MANFASETTIRAAIFDVLDGGLRTHNGGVLQWDFDNSDESDDESLKRMAFVNYVVKRIAELQSPPHDGVKIENLCDSHKRQVLPAPTAANCVICEAQWKDRRKGTSNEG